MFLHFEHKCKTGRLTPLRLTKPEIIKLESVDAALTSGLRSLCIGHDMLSSESYVSPFLKVVIGPLYHLVRFVLRKFGIGLADATSMHRHYDDAHFNALVLAARKAAEIKLNSQLSLVTALTHKAKYGEYSSWHNGYYSPYIYEDNVDVFSVWIPLQSTSDETGGGFRFWYGERIENQAKQLCRARWKQLDNKARATPADIMSAGSELGALYKLANDSDSGDADDRCTCYAQLGEAILFNEYWPHKTTKWVGEGVRLSIVLRFVRKGTRVNKVRLQRRKQQLKLDGADWEQYCTYISEIET